MQGAMLLRYHVQPQETVALGSTACSSVTRAASSLAVRFLALTCSHLAVLVLQRTLFGARCIDICCWKGLWLLQTLTEHRHALFKSRMHASASQHCPCLSGHLHLHTGTNAAPTALCPASYSGVVGEGGTKLEGVVVNDEEPGLATIKCTKADGTTATPASLPAGTTTVTCTARDRQGKTGKCSFDATLSACRPVL
jgi:hypothetical protein